MAATRVGYLGPEGTFSHEAAAKRFGADAELVAARSIAGVFELLHQGQAEHGVVPMENSTEGAVRATLDSFINYRAQPISGPWKTLIVGELPLEINLNLLGSGAAADVRTVYAHEQAIAQSRNWLEHNLPKAETVAVGSNAAAAQRVKGDAGGAAIASGYAAELYGLEVLKSGIQDSAGNTTRFAVLGSEEPEPSGNDKTSLMASLKHEPGALLKLLKPFSDNKINMLCLESRPIPGVSWEYQFFIEVAGHRREEPLAGVLEHLSRGATINLLGSYPAAV